MGECGDAVERVLTGSRKTLKTQSQLDHLCRPSEAKQTEVLKGRYDNSPGQSRLAGGWGSGDIFPGWRSFLADPGLLSSCLFPLRTEATARQAGRQMEPSRGGWYEIELRNLAEQPGL